MIRLAHLSDPHLPLPSARLSELFSKRFIGFQSWHRNRKRIHDPGILRALVADVRTCQPDHIVVTGDLVNISLKDEFAAAATWLQTLGPAL